MRSSSKGLKTSIQKKISTNNSSSTTLSDPLAQMNKTSLSSISTQSQKNEDKLLQLRQKLEKQRQNMRKTGRRFKDSSSSQIQIQTEHPQQHKQITSKMLNKSTKVSTGVGSSSSAGSSLYDFNSLKNQVQAKTRATFLKKNSNAKNQPFVPPVYTTQQILNSVNPLMQTQKSLTKDNKLQQSRNITSPVELKRQTVNLMQLSSVIQKSPTKNTSKQKHPIASTQDQSKHEIKFFDIEKVKKSHAKNEEIMANSRVFESAIKQQKKRNKEVQHFLSQVGLEQFTQNFISLGFDEVQTLIEVEVDDLNQMMMRARQQDKLMNFIKQFKLKNNIELTQQQTPLIDRPSSIKSRLGYRPKSAAMTTEPSQTNETAQNSRLRSTTQNFNIADSTLINKSSIFYFMGGDDWSLESQIRKACSGCFKVSYDAVKRGDCYYCEECDPGEMDEFDISLDESMVRDYH